jgi:Protein of unknown function (DUF2752)
VGRIARLGVVVLAALAMFAIGYVIATTRPTQASIYPKCPTFTSTGVHCPGCGTGRAVHFLLNGQFLTALQCNAFAPFLVPFLIVAAFRSLLGWALRRPLTSGSLIPAFWLWLLTAALLLYAVARNIPVEPFTHLAPKEVKPVPPESQPR